MAQQESGERGQQSLGEWVKEVSEKRVIAVGYAVALLVIPMLYYGLIVGVGSTLQMGMSMLSPIAVLDTLLATPRNEQLRFAGLLVLGAVYFGGLEIVYIRRCIAGVGE